MSDSVENGLREPEPPWFVNVTHMQFRYRPLCCSPVDYGAVKWSEDWSEVDCARCHRERIIPPGEGNDGNEG